jgi:GAF domain
MGWLGARLRGAIDSGIEGLIWLALLGVVLSVWKSRSTAVTLAAWVLVLALGIPCALLLMLLVRRWRGRGQWAVIAELEEEVELGAIFSRHIYDILDTLQKILAGTIPQVNIATFVEQGMLQPARDFLMQRPEEDVRLSVLVPDNSNWRMVLAAGYRLESKQRFSLPIVGSFSRHAYETGEIQWSFDLRSDPRFTPHPQATREYHSIISIPLRHGDDTVGVFNADSTLRSAFSLADFIYVSLLGAIISVVSKLGALDHARPGLDPGSSGADIGDGRNVH